MFGAWCLIGSIFVFIAFPRLRKMLNSIVRLSVIAALMFLMYVNLSNYDKIAEQLMDNYITSYKATVAKLTREMD